MLRNANDKRRWDADQFRRYRCRRGLCSWQGLLPVSQRRRESASRPHERADRGDGHGVMRLGRFALLALVVAGLAWGSITALHYMTGP